MERKARQRSVDRAIARVAEAQFGLVTREQLVDLGIGPEGIASRRRAGRLYALHRGVYLVGYGGPSRRAIELGAILALGRGAVLSHFSAAYFWELLPYPAQTQEVDVTVIGRKPHARPGLRVHRGAHLPRNEYCIRDGIPVTQVPRTLLDLAAVAPRHKLAEAVNEAHAKRRVGRAQLERIIDRYPGRAGTRALIDVAGLEGAGHRTTRSGPERRLLRRVLLSDLPPPDANALVGGYEVDLYWSDRSLVVEVDAWSTHGSRHAFERDRRRDARLAALGVAVIRVPAELIDADIEEAFERIRRAHAALAPAQSPQRP